MVAFSYIYYQANLFSKNKNVGFVSPKFPVNKSSNKILIFRAMVLVRLCLSVSVALLLWIHI